MSQPGEIRISFESREHEVRKALALFKAKIAPMALDDDTLGSLEIVLAEVLNNVVEHAYGETTSGPVRVELSSQGGSLFLNVLDWGVAMPESVLKNSERANVDAAFADLPEGGFGWFLVKDLSKNIHYARENGRNRVRIEMEIPAQAE